MSTGCFQVMSRTPGNRRIPWKKGKFLNMDPEYTFLQSYGPSKLKKNSKNNKNRNI